MSGSLSLAYSFHPLLKFIKIHVMYPALKSLLSVRCAPGSNTLNQKQKTRRRALLWPSDQHVGRRKLLECVFSSVETHRLLHSREESLEAYGQFSPTVKTRKDIRQCFLLCSVKKEQYSCQPLHQRHALEKILNSSTHSFVELAGE